MHLCFCVPLCSNSLCDQLQSLCLFLYLFFFYMPVNIPISTCVSSPPHGVNSQVCLGVSVFAMMERERQGRGGWRTEGAKAAETGEGTEEGGGGRWQVDYGRRSRCLETAGTRDARLLGDQHDAMTSAV